MIEKVCINCAVKKPLDEFYRHPQMTDGRLSACKACVKLRVRKHRQQNIDRIRAYDRERGQLPHRQQAVKGRAVRYKEKRTDYSKVYHERAPEKRKARNIVNNAIRDGKLFPQPCERCGDAVGVHAHHEDYTKPLDVNWLCPPCHGERHREINEERRRSAA